MPFKRLLRNASQFLLALTFTLAPAGMWADSMPVDSSRSPLGAAQAADELIAAVNVLRAENGLEAISAHPILMQVAQNQADYMAATGQVTHYSADGKRPFQRALEAGFPIAGDLSLGGFYSENITIGGNMTPQEAVESWMGDDPHRNTMLSEWRSHVGAGVAYSGDLVYYVLDTALYSSQPVSQTLPAVDIPTEQSTGWVPAAPIAVNTPGADGSVQHTVKNGETLWSIAAVYGISVEELVKLNALQSDQFIHAGDALLVQAGFTPTPSPIPSVTQTPTPQPERVQEQSPTRGQATMAVSLAPTATSFFPQETQREPLDVIVPLAMAIAFVVLVVILWYGFRKGAER